MYGLKFRTTTAWGLALLLMSLGMASPAFSQETRAQVITNPNNLVFQDRATKVENDSDSAIGYVIPKDAGRYLVHLHQQVPILELQIEELSILRDSLKALDVLRLADIDQLEKIRAAREEEIEEQRELVQDLQETMTEANNKRIRATRWNRFWKTTTVIFAGATAVLLIAN